VSKKRQSPVFNPQGMPAAQLTTLSYEFKDGYQVPEHFHKEDQLLFASKGVMTVRTEAGLWVVPPLRGVWIPGKQAHSIRMSGAVSMRTLYFSPSASKAVPKECFVLNISALFRELILHACTKPAWKLRLLGDRRIIELLLEQLRSATVLPLRLPRPKDARAIRVVEQLVEDPSDERTLGELCKDAGGSLRTIERAFLNETGMTFGKWRQQLRIFHAMKLLASGDKVTSAALDSGYNSPSAFIAAFKKSLGCTPLQFHNKGT
jgi:AraC-like DNA-binding protein/quercetin dioxygenase-like cupin family protein